MGDTALIFLYFALYVLVKLEMFKDTETQNDRTYMYIVVVNTPHIKTNI